MTRANGHGASGRKTSRCAFPLVGEVYLETTSGQAVRVIDTSPPARPPRKYLVEPANGSRPGQRWLCGGDELRGPLGTRHPTSCGSVSLQENRPASSAILERAAHLLEEATEVLEALARAGPAAESGLDARAKRLGGALRATAHSLAAAVPSAAVGEEATP